MSTVTLMQHALELFARPEVDVLIATLRWEHEDMQSSISAMRCFIT